jgi:superfamily I DNA/RNA helicase
MQDTLQQIAIYDWVKNPNPVKRNLIVPARAGSGKTSTATKAIQYMKGNVLAMAFNTKAAYQLKDKLMNMCLPNATGSTVHAAGKGMLYKAFGYHKVNGSKVYFLTEKFCKTEELMKCRNFIAKIVSFAKQDAFGVKDQTPIDDTQAWMDIIAHHDLNLEADVDYGTIIEIAKDVLIDSNRDTKCIDFDDMKYLPLFYDVEAFKYDWLVIDEAQDTNIARKLIVKKLIKPTTGRIIIIGDSGQAIYGFTGAENNSMDLMKEMFDCEELKLTKCFRCGKNIIEYAQTFFEDIQPFEGNPDGSISSLKYEEFTDQAMTLGLNRNDGIICRNNAPNVALAFALIRQGIGVRIEGKDIGKDLINLVKKWKRVTNLDEFTTKLHEFFTREFEKANYVKMQILEDKLDTMIILIERVQSLGKNDLRSLEDLITSMFTDAADGPTPNVVTLSSIHKAKGLEWNRVFWLGDAQFSPSRYAVLPWMVEQENNLRYVACTRAMTELINITDCPSRRNKED